MQVSVLMQKSRDDVWRAVEDVTTHSRWMLDATEVRITSKQRRGVGTTFDCDTAFGPLRLTDRMRITEWAPGRAMGVEHRGVVTGTGRFTLKRARRGHTRFAWEERLRFPWWMGGPVGSLVARPVFRAVWRRNLRSLKALVESGELP